MQEPCNRLEEVDLIWEKAGFFQVYRKAAKRSCFSQPETVWVALAEYS